MIFYSLKFLIIAQSSVLTLRLRDESCSTLETRRVNKGWYRSKILLNIKF